MVGAQEYYETGKCSYYADKFQGRNTTSGEKYDKDLFTAAHLTLPFNTLVRVTNLSNQKQVVVRINDRGPNTGGRLIDLSRAAAVEIGMIPAGVVMVSVERIGMADADSVKRVLEARRQAMRELQTKQSMAGQKKSPVQKEEKEKARVFLDQKQKVVEPGGYGLQVGIYKTFSQCRNAMHQMGARYNAQPFMYSEPCAQGMRYRLILGQFVSAASAEVLRNHVIRDIPDCFVVAYKDL